MNNPFAVAINSDPLWHNIRQAAVAMVGEEPIMASLVYASVLNQSSLVSVRRVLESSESVVIQEW